MQNATMGKLRLPPGPPFRRLDLATVRAFAGDPLEFVSRMVRDYGPVVNLRLALQPALLVAEPELVHDVLVTQNRVFVKEPRAKRVIRNMAGAGTIASEGDQWFRHRRVIQQGFAPERMEYYAAVIVAHAQRRVDRWTDGSTIDISAEMAELSLEIIAKSMLGLELTGRAAGVHDQAEVLSQAAVDELGSIVRLPDWLPLPSKRRKRAAFRGLEELIQSVIAERRAKGDDQGDMLSILLSSAAEHDGTQTLTDRQALDETLTLLHAGYDSSAAAMTWMWYLLALHPQRRDQVRSEVANVLGGRSATLADYDSLMYCQQVVKETIRVYPPAWMLMVRQATTGTALGEYSVRRGTWIFLSPWATHRSERFFPEPLQFDPDRFSPQRIGDIPEHAFYPFGLGPHRCVGERLAMIEMVLTLATVLQHCYLDLADKSATVEVELHTAIRPQGGLRVTVNQH
ncbi:MAG: cytochrome P450 [Bythopirellula sp.]